MMKFEIPFDENILRTQLELNFSLFWLKALRAIRTYLIMGILFFILGFFLVFNNTPAGYILIGLGTLLEFISILYWSSYQKQKKRIQNLITTESENNLKLNECLIWEFTNDYLRFKDYKCDIKIQWTFFKGFRLIDDHLFMDQNTEKSAAMILSQEEIGEENFKKVIKFVKEKIVIA